MAQLWSFIEHLLCARDHCNRTGSELLTYNPTALHRPAHFTEGGTEATVSNGESARLLLQASAQQVPRGGREGPRTRSPSRVEGGPAHRAVGGRRLMPFSSDCVSLQPPTHLKSPESMPWRAALARIPPHPPSHRSGDSWNWAGTRRCSRDHAALSPALWAISPVPSGQTAT